MRRVALPLLLVLVLGLSVILVNALQSRLPADASPLLGISFRIAAALPPLVPLRQTKDSIALKETAATNAFTDTVAVPEIVAFEYAGNLETARYRHTATLLRDGRVLVAGGRSLDHHVLSSTEVFSPTAGEWNSSGNFGAGGEGHTATLLPDGRVLALGGRNSQGDLARADFFDPATTAWLGGGDLLSYARSFHTATLWLDGIVLVAGGQGVDMGGYPNWTEWIYPTGSHRTWNELSGGGRAEYTWSCFRTDGHC